MPKEDDTKRLSIKRWKQDGTPVFEDDSEPEGVPDTPEGTEKDLERESIFCPGTGPFDEIVD